MSLGSLRILCVTLFVFGWAQQIHAQQQGVIPQPPSGSLSAGSMEVSATQQSANTQPVTSGQAVAPAPTLAPLLSPQAQAQQEARQAALAARNTPQQTTVSTQQNTNVAQQQAYQPSPAGALQPQQQQLAVIPAPSEQQQPVEAQAETAQVPAQAAAQASPVKVTNTDGFAPSNSGTIIPSNSGSMPLASTNPGMDMNLNPDIVGGVDMPEGEMSETASTAVPYEVQLEQRTRELRQQARGIAFEQAKKSVLPMESYEIRDVLGRLKDTQEAIQTPARPSPKPGNVIKTISTDPSATPQTINLAAGNVTTINIVDVTGEPWPIVDIGFGGAFDVKPPEAGGHVIRITPLKDFARGNLVVRLLKLTTPITFSLKAGGDTVNYRFDARIPDYGPNAKAPLIGEGINSVAGDTVTTSFLEGVPPKGAEKLVVAGIDGRTDAYKYGGSLYVRTPLSLISPAWQGSATSADGMNVYVLSDAPVLLLSDKGSLVRARLNASKKAATGF